MEHWVLIGQKKEYKKMAIAEVVKRVWHPDDALEQNYRLDSSPCRKAKAELEKNGKLERVLKSTFVFQVIRLKDKSYLWRKGPKKKKGNWQWKNITTNQLTKYFTQEGQK